MCTRPSVAKMPPLPDYLPPDGGGRADTAFSISAVRPLAASLSSAAASSLGTLTPQRINSLRCGCWLISYRPSGNALVAYDGTMRVECHSAGRTASGDLYQRPVGFLSVSAATLAASSLSAASVASAGLSASALTAGSVVNGSAALRPYLLAGPSPASGIPILARSRYRYYVRVTTLPENFYVGSSFTLGFELWRFTAPNSWAHESTMSAQMTRMTAPSGYPSPADYAEGDVTIGGAVVGRLTMGWLSSYYRRATIEIDTVSGSERPTSSGAGHNWATVMDAVGWQTSLVLSDTNVAEPSGTSWSDAEMHAAMLARRAAVNLDTEWRFHILAVKNIDSTPRGIMYDWSGTDSNNIPREGVGIASHWTISSGWGTVSGQRFGTAAAPYFRTAVHELGHAMGLYHNWSDMGFMCTSDTIAAAGTAATPFPSNVQWSFHPDNLKQLRHYPDPFVRPGGVAFGDASTTTPAITPTDLQVPMPGVALEVETLLGEVPLGAPIRIEYRVINSGEQAVVIPADLSLKSESVTGVVVDPSGTARSFRTVVRCVEDHTFVVLEPGASMAESATLMRGAEGALFAAPGMHRIQLEVSWHADGMMATLRGETNVLVTGAQDAKHAAAAHRVLSTPDAHLVLAIGGDHLKEGVAAVKEALGSKVLRPHFAVIEAKRIGRRFQKRKADVKAAAALIDADTVMSGAEIGRMARLAATDKTNGKTLARTLRTKAQGRLMPGAARQALDRL